MSEEKKKRIGEIVNAIKDLERAAQHARRDLAAAEAQIARLDAERWQLILTK